MTNVQRLTSISLISAALLFGHEVQTHQRIGDAAVAYLQQSAQYQNRPLLSGLKPLLEVGAVQEDLDALAAAPCPFSAAACPVLGRYYFHFNPPLNFSGPVLPFMPALGTFSVLGGCQSDAWGLQEVPCFESLTGTSALTGGPFSAQTTQSNSNRWSQDLSTDSNGAPDQAAIAGFGYLVHLLEDLGSPAHTRNDLHACPIGQIPLINTYCDPFEKENDASLGGGRGIPNLTVALALPTGASAVIPTTGFTQPQDFFGPLQQYISTHYYSENTIYAPNDIGPCDISACFEDSQYIYADCIITPGGFNVSAAAGTCTPVLINGTLRDGRKVAHKGVRYWGPCAVLVLGNGFNEAACDRTKTEIDQTIAMEQFSEIGPVLTQYVASFIAFYAPSVAVATDGTPGASITGTSNNASASSIDCGSTCSTLFVHGSQVTLTANAPGYTVQWQGDCSGTNPTNTLSNLNSDKTCKAVFQSTNGNCPASTICGSVTNHLNGAPLQNEFLSIQDLSRGSLYGASTNASGKFSLAVTDNSRFEVELPPAGNVKIYPGLYQSTSPGGPPVNFQVAFPPSVTVMLPAGFDFAASEANFYPSPTLPTACGPGIGVVCPTVGSFSSSGQAVVKDWVGSYWLTCILGKDQPNGTIVYYTTQSVQSPPLTESQQITLACPALP